MRHRSLALLLIVTVAGAMVAASIVAQGQKAILVSVVADTAGPLTDLTARDFVVREGKDARDVVGAELARNPLSLALLVDTAQPVSGTAAPTQDLRAALSEFVKTIHAASPDAQIAMMEVAGAAVTTVDFTTSSASLDARIQRLVPDQRQSVAMLEGIADITAKLVDKPAPRRAIVCVDFNAPEASAESTMKKVADAVSKAGVSVWTVSIGTPYSGTAPRDAVLNVITSGSGGMRLSAVVSTGLDGMLKRIANTILSQYTVAFSRPGSGNVNTKSLKIETARGAKVLLTPWMR